MRLSRDRLVLGAVVFSESAWLFSALGVAGLVFGLGGSPLSWAALLVLLGIPVIVGRVSPVDVAAIEIVYPVRALIGAALIYLVVATEVTEVGIELAWLPNLASDSLPDGYSLRAVSSAIIGVLLWWRGGRLASGELASESLSLSFRLGMLALAIATIVDIAHSAQLYTLPMVFIFFASGLGGLSVGHLLPSTQKTAEARTWHKVILGIVSVILLVGMAFSLIRKDLLFDYTRHALNGLDLLVQGVLWAIIAPISIAITVLTDALISFFEPVADRFDEAPARDTQVAVEQSLQLLAATTEQEEETGRAFFTVVQIIEVAFVALVVIGLLVMLVVALRRLFKDVPERTVGTRESVSEDVDVLSDLGRLLLKLVPPRLIRLKKRRDYALPDGPPGMVNVLRLYYELLTMAEDKGSARPPSETATEYERTLERLFPRNLVRMATGAFNRAIYGHHPAGDEQISQMRQALKSIKSAMGFIRGQRPG